VIVVTVFGIIGWYVIIVIFFICMRCCLFGFILSYWVRFVWWCFGI